MDQQGAEVHAPLAEENSERGFTWIAVLTTGIVMALLVRLRTSVDPDLWLHLRIGREIREGEWFRDLPDPLVILADRPYVPTQWLAEAAMEGLHAVGGVTALHLVRALSLVTLYCLVYLTARLHTTSSRAAGITLPAIVGTAAAWGERPQLIGLVLFALSLWLWSRAIAIGTAPWSFIPVVWLWAMLHGSWVLGIAMAAVVLAAAAVVRPRQPRRWGTLLAIAAGAIAAAAATPLGPGLVLVPFEVRKAAKSAVNEWMPPSPSNPLLWVVVLMIAVVVARSVRDLRSHLPQILLIIVALTLTVTAVRTIAFGALLAVPALASVLAPSGKDVASPRRSEAWPLVGLTVLLLAAPGVVIAGPSDGPLPQPMDSALHRAPAGDVVAVEPYSSGWILWAHPQLRPLRDLRSEVYSAETTATYQSFYRAEPGWEAYAELHRVNVLVLVDDSPLDLAAASNGSWRQLIRLDGHVIWQRGRDPMPLSLRSGQHRIA